MSNDENKTPRVIYFFTGLTALLAVTTVAIYLLNFNTDDFGSREAFGLFGDYIGGLLNPILTFFTVVLLIWSIKIQMKELRDSTAALQASQESHQQQVEVSTELLDEAKKTNAAQLDKMRVDSIRAQLTQNAEMLNNECRMLMIEPFFDHAGDKLKMETILYLQRRKLNSSVQHIIDCFPSLMTEEKPKNPIIKIHLLTIRDKVNLAAETIIDLLPMLERNSLQSLWLERIQDLIDDCEKLRIFDNQEAFLLTERLTTAINEESF